MSIIKWHDELSSKIRLSILFFIFLLILDSSTLFDISISETFTTSSNLSTWVSSLILGIGFIDSFSFHLVSVYLLLIILLSGAIKSPYRNIWVLQFTLLSTAAIIFVTSYQLIEPSNQIAVLVNGFIQCIKLIPLILAYHWTKQLSTPILI